MHVLNHRECTCSIIANARAQSLRYVTVHQLSRYIYIYIHTYIFFFTQIHTRVDIHVNILTDLVSFMSMTGIYVHICARTEWTRKANTHIDRQGLLEQVLCTTHVLWSIPHLMHMHQRWCHLMHMHQR
jgi:hypothetical protein